MKHLRPLATAFALALISCSGFAAEFRILADLDNSAATGCTVNGMAGVDRVVMTTVDTSGAAPRVTSVTRQDCAGGSLGTPITIDNNGWPAATNTTTGITVVETRIPLAVFGSPLPPVMRLGFVVSSGTQTATILSDADGNPILFPGAARRRSVGGAGRSFILDGLTEDWTGLSPLAIGDASQSNLFRLLGVWAFLSGDSAYFRFDEQSQSGAPTALDDSYSTPLHTPLSVPAAGVLANDIDPNARPLTAHQLTAPERGVLVLNPDGSLTYTPDDAGPARETFTYQASNGSQPSNIAQVEIRVGQANHPPNATDDNYSVGQGGTLDVAAPGVLGNDTDPDGDALHAVLSATTAHGTLALHADGSFHYVNDGASLVDDQFTYFANDGVANSNEATVRIHVQGPAASAPQITITAKNQTVCAGTTATFSASATGQPLPKLQWWVSTDGGATFTPIAGANVSPYSFPATVADNGNQYRAVFTNLAGTASTTATLTVSTPPAVTTSPVSTTVCAGTPAAFQVVAGGSASTVQWQVSTDGGATFTPIAGATSPTYSFTPTAADNGHEFRAVLTNACGTATSAAATLTVDTAPAITTQPAAQAVCAGATASFTAAASGTPVPTIQWQVSTDGGATFTNLAGATSGTYSFATAAADNGKQFRAVFTNSCAATSSSAAILTVNTAPVVTTGPATQTVTVTFPATFTVAASGQPAPAVQWQISTDGGATFANIAGATALTYSFTTSLGDTGHQFRAVLTNPCGSATSAVATLTVVCPTITVTSPATTSGTVSSAFNQTFTESGGIGAVTFTTASALPAGLTLAANGTLSGTPSQTGTFPITVTATDAQGCSGTGASYNLVIGCQTITVTSPGTTTGTINAAFSQQFSETGGVGAVTFTTASTLPTGLTLSSSGLLSGTPAQPGTFPITVTVKDGNNCTGTSATYNLVIACQTITVTNPVTSTGTVGTALSQTFTQTGAIGATTFSTASALPAGLTLSAAGALSGTPTQSGTFPIVVTATDANGCTGSGATYNLVISCQTITVTNPGVTSGTANTAFSQTFTQSGALAGATFSTASTLPAGLSLNAATGVLSGTPTQTGTFNIVVQVTDGHGCTGSGPAYTLTIGCQTITVTNPATTTGTANTPFSQTFTASNTIGATTFTTASALPLGLALATNGTLSGTPLVVGTFPIVVKATDGNGCSGTGATYNLVIGCQTITVNNPATTTGTVGAAFSQTFTATNAIGTTTFSESGALPAGLTFHTATGVLDGTPTVLGTFPITVTATDGNGCTGTGATYNLTINCQTITVTSPATNTGTVSSPFSQQFTQSGAIGGATFTTASALPTGLTLSSGGLLSGTPMQPGTFPITVTVTDGNGCTGTSATYNLVINCQTIAVTNPASSSDPAGTALVAANFTFTQTGAVGGATFTTASTLPTGVTLTSGGVLSGTPTGGGGTFPITVTVTDGNGCTGTSSGYVLTITCPTITVTNPGVSTGTAGVAFSQTFTQSGGNGTITWSESGTLPTGITLNSATGVLSGTTHQVGSFPITVTATDQNGCQGSGAQYTLTINCQTITVTNPVVNSGTVDSAFSQTFTVSGILDTVTWSETGTLPAGITLSSATGVLSGTPTVNGTFPITVKATDTNGCFGTSAYTLTINCQTITVTNPVTTSGTVDAPFSQTFTQSGAHGTAAFSTSSTLPPGLSLSAAGVLSGTPTQPGAFPIVVRVTDANGCTGIGATYTLAINCQTITVTNPATATGTVNVAFSETFTQSGAHGTATFSTASTLPTGFTLDSSTGVLSGTTTDHSTFPIVVTVTDSNGCTGSGPTYNLVIACELVTNPANTSGTVGAPFSEQFTSAGGVGAVTFSTTSTLPTGLTLSSTGLLSGTTTQTGTFPIVVRATDSTGCFTDGPAYNLVIACNTITVTNPGVSTGTAGTAFSQTFTQSGGNGTITWSESGALPSGITLNSSTGVLSGTTNTTGSFPITVTATDANGCQGSSNYTLTINCQTIAITNPAQTSVQSGTALDVVFTASGILGTVTWSETGTLPSGITLNSSTGHLAGTTTQTGSFPITVKATDTNGCFGTASYTLTVTCPTITVARNGGGSFPAGTIGTSYSGQSFVASGGTGPYTFAVTSGTFPTSLTLASSGSISGTPTATGTFAFSVTATDANACTGTASFSIAIDPAANPDTYSNLVNNTEAVVTGGVTGSPTTPFVALTGSVRGNDLPSGGVAVSAGTSATTQGGSVTIGADGTFKYTPPVTATALTSDTFTYTIVSDTASTGTPTSATGTVTLNLSGRVWYVVNSVTNGNGQSQSPFNSLSNFTNGARVSPDTSGDIIFVYTGDGSTTNLNAGVVLLANEQLIGEGVALVVNGNTLVTAGTKPQITNATANSDAVTLNDGNTVKGVTITGATRDGIAGASHAGFTADTLTIQNNVASGLHLTSMTGTVTVTNATITGNATGLDVNNGTAAITLDNTNTIAANAGQRSVSIQNRPAAAGTISLGTAITDNGTGILVNANTSGTINFTGTQTLSTTTNTAVNLTSNTGTTIDFSGTLGVTTTTGTGFNATGGGTLNVLGTANVTTGAAAAGVNLNGVTVGGSGATFTSVNTTGATTGVSLTSLGNGNVTVSGGTISGGGTGVSLSTLGTSTTTLSGLTITGATTGITGSTFGTLSIGSSVNVSAGNALSLNTGTLTGTFANISSTGNASSGVSLTSVNGSGTWGAGAGSLASPTAVVPTFNISGGSGGTMTWGGSMTQAQAANVVTIASSNAYNATFSGSVTTSGASTGISISASSGTYNFTGAASTITGTGGGITIFNESGTISFGSGYSINGPTTSFKIGGTATNVSANITYSGTITNTVNGGVVLDVNSAAGTFNGTLTMNGSSLSGNSSGVSGVVSVIKNMTGTLSVSNLSLTSSNTSFNNTLLAISGTNTGGSFTFTNLTLSATGTGHTGVGLSMTGGGTLTLSGGTIDVSSTALSLSGIALGTGTLTSASSSGGTNGISLTSITGGTLTISGGTLTGNTGTAFNVATSSATLTYGGAITQNTASQKAVGITGVTAGTLTLSGSVTSNGGAGISVAGSGGTVTFTGNITLNNTASVFTASGGVTINATNTSSTIGATNAVTTTQAVNITTTIGTSGVTFRSVSANGPTNGILLLNTGSGNFTVTGDGGGVNNGSGGTIQATTGHGISVTNAGGTISLNYINVTNPGLTGIQVIPTGWVAGGTVATTGAGGFTMNRCNISDNAGNTSADDGLTLANATGTVSITNNVFTAARHQGVTIDNYNKNITNFTMTGNTIQNTPGGDGMLMEMRGTSVMTSGAIGGNTLALGNTFSSNSATGLQINNADTGNIASMNVQNNMFTGNNAGTDFDLGQGSSYNVTVENNTYTNQHATACNFVQSTAATGGTLTALIRSNTIGAAGVFDSGSAIGSGIRIANGGVSVNLTIDSNIIREVPNGRGIDIEPQAYTVNANVKVKIVNNTVARPSGTNQSIGCGAGVPCPLASIFVLSDSNGLGGFDHVCTTISGNSAYDPTSWPAGGEAAFYFARRTTTSNTLQLEGTQANVTSQILSNNIVTNFTFADVFDEGAPTMPTTIVAAGTCGTFP